MTNYSQEFQTKKHLCSVIESLPVKAKDKEQIKNWYLSHRILQEWKSINQITEPNERIHKQKKLLQKMQEHIEEQSQNQPDLTGSPDQNFSCPEFIFTVPSNISRHDCEDSIRHTLDRIKGTILTTAQLIGSATELPHLSIKDCLLGAYAQLEIMEKLIIHQSLEKT